MYSSVVAIEFRRNAIGDASGSAGQNCKVTP
jgi:hypothetical protein